MKKLFLCAALAGPALMACEREKRDFHHQPAEMERKSPIVMTSLSAGPAAASPPADSTGKSYENNAYHISQGKQLYSSFNCKGCHANGGGDSGPPLMDDKWIYGGAIANIVQTIREGRPNGMPSFRGRIPDEQIWEIAAYVRSMTGNVPKAAAPARNDALHPGPAEQRRPASPPVEGGSVPPSAQRPK